MAQTYFLIKSGFVIRYTAPSGRQITLKSHTANLYLASAISNSSASLTVADGLWVDSTAKSVEPF